MQNERRKFQGLVSGEHSASYAKLAPVQSNEVGPRIKKILDARGLRPVDFGKALDAKASDVSGFLKGKHGWKLQKLEKAAEFLHVPIESLLTSTVTPVNDRRQGERRQEGTVNKRRRHLVEYLAEMTGDELTIMEAALGRVLTRRELHLPNAEEGSS